MTSGLVFGRADRLRGRHHARRAVRAIGPSIGGVVAALWLSTATPDAFAIDGSAADIAQGRSIAEQLCARCHAISGPGPSPVPEAPLFSQFERKWPVEYLEEALAEGIVTGHGPVRMPEFVFWPDEIRALLAYLKSVQE
jgi:mono/diheme cytochrome c family protein